MTHARRASKEGAAIVESCLAIIMLCLILFGLLQVSYLIMARDVISFSAFASARALAVGMSEEFVERVAHVTTIPTAGPPSTSGNMLDDSMSTDGTVGQMWDRSVASSPGSSQYWYEDLMIQYYLGADDESMLDGLLNYFYWVTEETEVSVESSEAGSERAEVTVRQSVPMAYPFADVFFSSSDRALIIANGESGGYTYDEVPVYDLEQNTYLENHSALYLTEE